MLGQVRAQLRSCVFKVIDNQDQVESRKSSFHFENPRAKELRSSKDASLMAMLIQEFLEFYRLDYSLAIFKPETNLAGGIDKNELAQKAGIADVDASQPLLLQLLSAFNAGDRGNSKEIMGGAKKALEGGFVREEFKKVEPLSFKGLPDESNKLKSSVADSANTDKHLAKANNLLAELEDEQKRGFNLGQSQDDDFDMDASDKKKAGSKKTGGLGAMNLNGGGSKETGSDAYDEDFDDDIPEDLPEDKIDLNDDADLNARSANVAGSGQGITVSQSLGVDPSVDSLALEDYDHVEPVERIA